MLTKIAVTISAILFTALVVVMGMLSVTQGKVEDQAVKLGKYKVAVDIWENSYQAVVMEIEERDRKVKETLAEREALSRKAGDLKDKLDEATKNVDTECGKVLTPKPIVDLVLRNAGQAPATEAVPDTGSALHDGDTAP